MKLYHVSEQADIREFVPRPPSRADLDPGRPLVWAITQACLPNFLTPRDCPRVAYHATEETNEADIARFFSGTARHCVAIEGGWYSLMAGTRLYLYELGPQGFYLQDPAAGYWVSEQTQTPRSVTVVDDLFSELTRRGAEVRLVDSLWPLADRVRQSTLNWSLCRMAHAKPRPRG